MGGLLVVEGIQNIKVFKKMPFENIQGEICLNKHHIYWEPLKRILSYTSKRKTTKDQKNLVHTHPMSFYKITGNILFGTKTKSLRQK